MCRTISRRTDPMRRHPSSWLRWVALVWAVVVVGCAGGSGSSGFDAALKKENAAIERALDAQTCEEIDGLTICASGGQPSPVPSGTPTIPEPQLTATPRGTTTPTPIELRSPTPSPTFTPAAPSAPGVDTNLGPRDSIECQQSDAEAPCLFVFTFQPMNVPPEASYAVAVRTRDPDSPWTITQAPANSAPITVDPGGPDYQIAVLVYLEAPGFIPAEVDLLGDSGADFAFVTPVLSPEMGPLTLRSS